MWKLQEKSLYLWIFKLERFVFMESMGKRLEEIRHDLGLSVSEFVDQLNIGKSAYYNYRNGDRPIPGDVLQILSQMGFDTNWVLTGQGSMYRQETKKAPAQSGGQINDHDVDHTPQEKKAYQEFEKILAEIRSEKQDLEELKFAIEKAKKEKGDLDSKYTALHKALDQLTKEERDTLIASFLKIADAKAP